MSQTQIQSHTQTSYDRAISDALARCDIDSVTSIISTLQDSDLVNAIEFALDTDIETQKKIVARLMGLESQSIEETLSEILEQGQYPRLDTWFQQEYL